MIPRDRVSIVAAAWAERILAEERDPATWLARLRRDIEALELPVSRCLELPTTISHATLRAVLEADKNNYAESRVIMTLGLEV